MQKIPEPPKSYSLIQNLRPSISLSGQQSEPDEVQHQGQLELRPQIANDLNQIIDTVQTSDIVQLKKVLKAQITQLESLKIQEHDKPIGPFGNIDDSQDIVISKLKQLALISDILVQRMNEKYAESKTLYEEFFKETALKKKSISIKFAAQEKRNKAKERKIDVSQQTQKKPMIYDEEKRENLQIEDQKKTRKQDTKLKAKK